MSDSDSASAKRKDTDKATLIRNKRKERNKQWRLNHPEEARERRRNWERNRSRVAVNKGTADKLRELQAAFSLPSLGDVICQLIERYEEKTTQSIPSEEIPSSSRGISSGFTARPSLGVLTSTPVAKMGFARKMPSVQDAFRMPSTNDNSDSDAISLRSSVSSIHNPQTPMTAGAVLGNDDHEASESSGRDDQDVDISVSFFEKGEFIYPHEVESDYDDGDDDHDDDDDDEDYLPEIEALLQQGRSCANMHNCGEEDEVLGEGEPEAEEVLETRSGLHIKQSAADAKKAELYIITKSRLEDLAMKAKSTCHRCGSRVQVQIKAANGSAAHITWVCPDGHDSKWCSQETVNRSHVGDLRIAAATLISGNNIRKVCLLAKFASLNFMHYSSFHTLQRKYMVPAIEEEWKELQASTLLKHQAPLVLCGDGRNDSPGYSAQYITYTFMEHNSKDIIHCVFVDKREVAMKSPVMEMEAFRRGIREMEEKGIKIKEIITDAHTSIAKHMRVNRPDIKHSWDIWHGAKNLGKKLSKVSSKAATRGLIFWIKHVLLHFWFCARTCAGDVRMLKKKWRGLTHHVTNKHTWVSGLDGPAECEHEPLDPEKEKREEWLQPGSDPHRALVQVTFDRKFMENFAYFARFRHTSMLECFHNHILMYASKRYSFDYPAYRARNLLAGIDYMAHKDRPDQTDEQGNTKHVAVWSKHANNYVARKMKVPKTYPYVQGLIGAVLERREQDQGPLFSKAVLLPDDPRHTRPRLAPFPPPPVDVILARRLGRLEKST